MPKHLSLLSWRIGIFQRTNTLLKHFYIKLSILTAALFLCFHAQPSVIQFRRVVFVILTLSHDTDIFIFHT